MFRQDGFSFNFKKPKKSFTGKVTKSTQQQIFEAYSGDCSIDVLTNAVKSDKANGPSNLAGLFVQHLKLIKLLLDPKTQQQVLNCLPKDIEIPQAFANNPLSSMYHLSIIFMFPLVFNVGKNWVGCMRDVLNEIDPSLRRLLRLTFFALRQVAEFRSSQSNMSLQEEALNIAPTISFLMFNGNLVATSLGKYTALAMVEYFADIFS